MNILLTGGAGYIGSHTSLALLDKGHEVTVIDSLITGNERLVPKTADFVKCDVSDEQKITNLIKKKKFDVVMHFAGLVRVEESIKDPKKYELHNYEKAKSFVNICIKEGLNNLIFSSTAGVYGVTKEIKKIDENKKIDPINPYAISKYKFENYLIDLSRNKKLNATILRYFNVAGADSKNRTGLMSKNSNNLIKVACEVATKKRKKIIINGEDYNTNDGSPVRDFIHVSDLADMHVVVANKIILEKETNIYNCGYGSGYSVKEVINEMEKILDYKLNKEIGERRPDDISYSVADSQKFEKKFKWKPKYNDLNYILKSALKWEKLLK